MAQTVDPREIIKTLILLSEHEDALASLSQRSTRRDGFERSIKNERKKLPQAILSHHDRIRALGRPSVAGVRNWICRACFLSVHTGMRTRLIHGNDINICENCGAYIYLEATPEEEATTASANMPSPEAASTPLMEPSAQPKKTPIKKTVKAKKKAAEKIAKKPKTKTKAKPKSKPKVPRRASAR